MQLFFIFGTHNMRSQNFLYTHITFSAKFKVQLKEVISINPWGRVVIAEHKKGYNIVSRVDNVKFFHYILTYFDYMIY